MVRVQVYPVSTRYAIAKRMTLGTSGMKNFKVILLCFWANKVCGTTSKLLPMIIWVIMKNYPALQNAVLT